MYVCMYLEKIWIKFSLKCTKSQASNTINGEKKWKKYFAK